MFFQGFSVAPMLMLKQLLKIGGRYGWLSCILWVLFIGAAQAAVELRVAVKNGTQPLKIGSSTHAIVKDSNGNVVGEIQRMDAYTAQVNGGGVALDNLRSGNLWIEPQEDGFIWIGDRWYRGRTRLVRNGDNLMAVNYVNLEDYLYSVVGAEAVPSWPAEALKAQAVAARTYALYKRGNSATGLYDLDTTTATQVYKGLESEYNTTHQAVNATQGQVMTYNGQVILAAFHASSGGHTENVENIWSNRLPYLRGVIDYDQSAPVYQWSKVVPVTQLSTKIKGVGTVRSLVPTRKTPQGRIVTMKVIGDRGTKIVSGSDLRKALNLRSTLFDISENGGNFQIYGKGFGHGVGLSQWGAYGLAQQGANYQRILSHYYQNASLASVQVQ